MRTMFDSVTPGNIPADAEMVAGYIDGKYRWKPADWARFPHAIHVRIAVSARTLDGDVLDVERGDATPGEAPGWVQARRAQGADPTVYCSYSARSAVRQAFAAAGVAEPHWWFAAYPGIGQQLYVGTVAHQWIDDGPYDRSIVADYWPGVDPPPPTRNNPGDDDMTPDQARQLQIVHDIAVINAVHDWYKDSLGRPPSGEEMMEQIAAINSNGANAVYAGIANGPEAKTHTPQ